MKDKELLIEAVDNYNILPSATKTVLKTLIKLAKGDNTVEDNILDLSTFSKVSRPSVYTSLKTLEIGGFIHRQHEKGSRFNAIILYPQRLNDIIDHYIIRKKLYTFE